MHFASEFRVANARSHFCNSCFLTERTVKCGDKLNVHSASRSLIWRRYTEPDCWIGVEVLFRKAVIQQSGPINGHSLL